MLPLTIVAAISNRFAARTQLHLASGLTIATLCMVLSMLHLVECALEAASILHLAAICQETRVRCVPTVVLPRAEGCVVCSTLSVFQAKHFWCKAAPL